MAILPEHPIRTDTPATRRARQRRTNSIAGRLKAVNPRSAAAHVLCRQLIEANLGVALTMAKRFRDRGIDLEDLEQVALLGLTKAAQRFDAASGHDFLSFAVPTIRGELRRHFRDHGWTIRPPRSIQELQGRITRAQGELEQLLQRSPRPSEIAQHLHVDVDTVIEALSIVGHFKPTSLDAPTAENHTPLGEMMSDNYASMHAVETKLLLEQLTNRLPPRDRRILHMRFYEERTQQQIADELGVTQAQVSRLLARIMADLRASLVDHKSAA